MSCPIRYAELLVPSITVLCDLCHNSVGDNGQMIQGSCLCENCLIRIQEDIKSLYELVKQEKQ